MLQWNLGGGIGINYDGWNPSKVVVSGMYISDCDSSMLCGREGGCRNRLCDGWDSSMLWDRLSFFNLRLVCFWEVYHQERLVD